MTMRQALGAIISTISADLVGRGLTESSLPALTQGIGGAAGAIYFGTEFLDEQVAGPKVVAEWVGMGFTDRNQSVLASLLSGNKPNAETIGPWSARPLANMTAKLKFTCWGIADPTQGASQDPTADRHATFELACAVIRSAVNVLPGLTLEDGGRVYGTSDTAGPTLVRYGWAASFYMTVPIPVLDYAIPIVGVGGTPPTPLVTTQVIAPPATTPQQGFPAT